MTPRRTRAGGPELYAARLCPLRLHSHARNPPGFGTILRPPDAEGRGRFDGRQCRAAGRCRRGRASGHRHPLVNPPYIGPPLPSFDDGSSMNLWGIRRRPMPNEYGEYAEAGRNGLSAGRPWKRPKNSPGPIPIGSTIAPCRRCARAIPTWPLKSAAPTCRTSSTAWPSDAASSRCCWTSPWKTRCTCISSSAGTASTLRTSSVSSQQPRAASIWCAAATISAASAAC